MFEHRDEIAFVHGAFAALVRSSYEGLSKDLLNAVRSKLQAIGMEAQVHTDGVVRLISRGNNQPPWAINFNPMPYLPLSSAKLIVKLHQKLSVAQVAAPTPFCLLIAKIFNIDLGEIYSMTALRSEKSLPNDMMLTFLGERSEIYPYLNLGNGIKLVGETLDINESILPESIHSLAGRKLSILLDDPKRHMDKAGVRILSRIPDAQGVDPARYHTCGNRPWYRAMALAPNSNRNRFVRAYREEVLKHETWFLRRR